MKQKGPQSLCQVWATSYLPPQPPSLPKVWEIEQNEWRIELWVSEKLALELEAEVVLLDFQEVRNMSWG